MSFPDSTDADSKECGSNFRSPINPLWSQFTSVVQNMIQGFVVTLAVHAARHPKSYITCMPVLSIALISAGFFTNFNINTDEQVIYAPFKTRTASHMNWRREESGFPDKSRTLSFNIHNDGANVLKADNIRKLFSVLDEVRAIPGYEELCSKGDHINQFNGERTCMIKSLTRFFQHDVNNFDNVYAAGGEDAIIETVSAETYENGAPVDTSMILGNTVRDNETGLIVSTELMHVYFLLPDIDGVGDVEDLVLLRMPLVQAEWNTNDSVLKMEYFCMKSYSKEFRRAIEEDLYLLPIAFFLMSAFTCLVFFKCDRVQSRSTLGAGAVVTIVFSLMSGFGLMFCIGVPFTSMTQILPFVGK
jgi:Patched family